MAVRKGGLGKGLDALFIDSPEKNLTKQLWLIWPILFGSTA